jgi:hypothetical protein
MYGVGALMDPNRHFWARKKSQAGKRRDASGGPGGY